MTLLTTPPPNGLRASIVSFMIGTRCVPCVATAGTVKPPPELLTNRTLSSSSEGITGIVDDRISPKGMISPSAGKTSAGPKTTAPWLPGEAVGSISNVTNR